MKTRKILFGILLSIGLFATSCSSDDNEGETLVPLASKWDLSQTGIVVGDSEQLVDAPQNQSGCRKDYLDLKLSNSVELGDYGPECALTTSTGTYVRSHNDLTVTIGGISQTSDIMNLTNKELKLKDKTTGIISVYTR